MRKIVIMVKEKPTGLRVLVPGERVSVKTSVAERWVADGIASWPDAGGKPQAIGKKASGGGK